MMVASNPRSRSLASWLKRDPNEPGLSPSMKRNIVYFNKLHTATPLWADKDVIDKYYEEASRLGKHVDHIVPICNDYVCGLHCENNLQLLDPKVNMSKSNHDWPDSPYERHHLFDDPNEPEQYELPL